MRLGDGDSRPQASIVGGAADDLARRVRDGSLHVALCFQDAAEPRREHPDTRRVDLLHEPMLVALHPEHRLAGRRSLRLSALADEPWLAASSEGLIANACRAAGFEPRLAYLTADSLAIRALVAAGLAVTLVPRLLAAHVHGIATVTIAGAQPARVVYALMPAGAEHPLVPALLAALRAEASPS
jgi:DNA-binding transcriptional LysR family regulator